MLNTVSVKTNFVASGKAKIQYIHFDDLFGPSQYLNYTTGVGEVKIKLYISVQYILKIGDVMNLSILRILYKHKYYLV